MMKIKCYNFKYDSDELRKWSEGDKELVPEEVLNWKGPGRQNGYGYGEYWVERYLKDKGYLVIAGEYNLSTDNSKYKENNVIIEKTIGEERYRKLIKRFREYEKEGKRIIEQPDIFAFKDDNYMFIEVKKDKDYLRDPQKDLLSL